MLEHWLWLAHRKGVSDRVKRELLSRFPDPEDIYHARSYDQVEGLTKNGLDALLDKKLTQAESIAAKCSRMGIHILTLRDEGYPRRLKNIDDPPLVLYYKGILPDWEALPAIGVVGTRKASPYGLSTAKRLGYEIAKCGGILVSGAASGIDGVSMGAALAAQGVVVGVLGCGVDVVYPRSNDALFAQLEEKGCLISEFAPGTEPFGYHFPRRNRVISGLSNGVLIVEAPHGSGSLITARRAMEQGRDIFVVPGNINMETFAGNFDLLKDGATPVRCGWDVVGEYAARYPGKVRQYTSSRDGYAVEVEEIVSDTRENTPSVAQKPRIPRKNTRSKVKNEKKAIDNGESAPYSDLNKVQPKLTAEEQMVYSALGREPRPTDDVIAQVDISAPKVLAILTSLQIRGVVRKHPGNYVSLK